MSFWIEADAEGRVLQTTICDDEPRAVRGGAVHPADYFASPGEHLFLDGALVNAGPQPTPGHFLDPASRGWVLPSTLPPLPPTQKKLEDALEAEMHRVARLHGYRDLDRAISYRGSPDPLAAADGEAFFVWRSDVWVSAREYRAAAARGEVPFPISEAQAIALMPPLNLPPP